MNNPYLGYNPVFEQLAETARNNSNKLQEAAGDINAEETQEYLKTIIDTLTTNILFFTGTLPYEDLVKQIYVGALEQYTKLGNNASIKDLFTSLYAIWDDAMKKIRVSKYKDSTEFIKIYEDINKAINNVMESWAALQAKAGNFLLDTALLEFVNTRMKESIATAQKSLEAAKGKLA
jgi:hypothetical protein